MDINFYKFSREHIWILHQDEGYDRIGISDYAQKKLKTIVFANLPEPGSKLVCGQPFGDVESIKSVAELIAPADAEVVKVNEHVLDDPECIHTAPYENWLLEVICLKYDDRLMDAAAYLDYVEKL